MHTSDYWPVYGKGGPEKVATKAAYICTRNSRTFFYMFSVAMAEEKHPLFLHCRKCQDMLGGMKEEV